jgi:hypothetical protein
MGFKKWCQGVEKIRINIYTLAKPVEFAGSLEIMRNDADANS